MYLLDLPVGVGFEVLGYTYRKGHERKETDHKADKGRGTHF